VDFSHVIFLVALPCSALISGGIMSVDAAVLVEDQVRELVRRRGLDPASDTGELRRLVDEVVAHYGALPELADPSDTSKRVFDAVAGFGPLQPYLDDESVEELWVNDPGRVFVARNGRSELTTTILSDDQVRDLVERMLESSGRRVDLSTPFVDAMLPDGSRLHVVIPDITRRHWAVNVRKFVARANGLDELVALGTLTSEAASFLAAAVVAGLNIIVSGGTQAGKTTLLNCLVSAVPPRERVVTCEEVFELRLNKLPDTVAMQTRQPNLEGTGEVTLRRLVVEALRMRPDRIIVGEVRARECLDLLIALNSGLPGMCSLHANSARDAIVKLCTLPLLAGENVTHAFVVPTVASCIDLVVHIESTVAGTRQVTEILAVPGRAEGGVVESATVFHSPAGRLTRGAGWPPHADRFSRAGYDLATLLKPA
jgi:pilus assembly protein CpaF